MSNNEVTLKEHFESKLSAVNEKIEQIDSKVDKLEGNLSNKIDEKIDNLSKIMSLTLDKIDGKVDQTYEQAKKTNGRVNKHDEKFEKLEKLHANCPGSKALDELKTNEKIILDKLTKRVKKQEDATKIFVFLSENPKISKGILIALIITLIIWASKLSVETVPQLIQLFFR